MMARGLLMPSVMVWTGWMHAGVAAGDCATLRALGTMLLLLDGATLEQAARTTNDAQANAFI
jgi:hypothetical protein